MTSRLAIDSGSPLCACAAARRDRLWFVDELALADLTGTFDRVAVEIPQIRPDTPNGDDLILIAVAGARMAQKAAGRNGEVVEYRPSQWKGSVPKPPHHARMWDALKPEEQKMLGGVKTKRAIDSACLRGAQDCWRKKGNSASYYRASEFPTVNGTKITHNILDAVALALYDMGRIPRG